MTDQMHAAPEQDGAAGATEQPAGAVPTTPPDAPPPQQPYGQPWLPPQPYGQPWANQPWPPQQPYDPSTSAPPAAPPAKSRFGIGFLVGFGVGFAVPVAGFFLFLAISLQGAPANLGDSERADVLYGLCNEGEMVACDTLYLESAIDSQLEEFGATCGGRVTIWQDGNCIEAAIEAG